MAKTYRLTPIMRLFNGIMKVIVQIGRGPEQTYILTVRGRTSGKEYSLPVSLVIEDQMRWLVSPYGEVSWVLNARAAGQVMLTRGQKREMVSINELDPQESAPILKKYIQQEPFPRPYFDADPEAPVEAFEAEASAHPVFLLTNIAESSDSES